eukprot:g56998.t1
MCGAGSQWKRPHAAVFLPCSRDGPGCLDRLYNNILGQSVTITPSTAHSTFQLLYCVLVPIAPQASLDLLRNPDWTDAEIDTVRISYRVEML